MPEPAGRLFSFSCKAKRSKFVTGFQVISPVAEAGLSRAGGLPNRRGRQLRLGATGLQWGGRADEYLQASDDPFAVDSL